MKSLTIALDWTPNINHIGILIAQEKGFYKSNDISLSILNPLEDNYAMTPAKKVETGIAQFAIAPFESVISYNNKQQPFDLIAVFAILQEDLSSIATLETANIDSPKQLDEKIYASYKARYEDYIVKQMIKNDGGEGLLRLTYPDKLGIWNLLLTNKADATWIFDNWEGIEAKKRGVALRAFSLKDYQIPYSYSPVIIASKSALESEKEHYQKFIKSTREGYLYTHTNPSESVKILRKYLTEHDRENINLVEALEFTAPHFGNQESCGLMEKSRVSQFVDWLVTNDLEQGKIKSQTLFTNVLVG